MGIAEAMIKFMYTGEVENLNTKAAKLMEAADRFDLSDMKKMCEISLEENMNVDNVIDYLVLADLHNAENLKKEAITMILANFEKIIAQEDCKQKLKEHHAITFDLLVASA